MTSLSLSTHFIMKAKLTFSSQRPLTSNSTFPFHKWNKINFSSKHFNTRNPKPYCSLWRLSLSTHFIMKAKLTFHPKTFITEINFSFSQMSLETFHPNIPLGTLNPAAACDASLSLSLSLLLEAIPGKCNSKPAGTRRHSVSRARPILNCWIRFGRFFFWFLLSS